VPACPDLHASGFDSEGAEKLKHKLVGHKKWIGTAGKFILKSVYQLADLCTYKNCTWHSRTEEFRKLTSPIEARITVSLQLLRSRLADFDTPDGSEL
jgi:hypothetical protein